MKDIFILYSMNSENDCIVLFTVVFLTIKRVT